MLSNLERVFANAKATGLLGANAKLSGYKFQSQTRTFTLTSDEEVSNQPVDFPAGAVILRVGIEASEAGKNAGDARGTLDMIRIAFDLPSFDGTLTAGGEVRASCLVGRNGDAQWPEKPLVMGKQGSINLTLKNLTKSTIDVDVAFHTLISRHASG
jgi:hypothetical protein